jgi:hypothetical protein
MDGVSITEILQRGIGEQKLIKMVAKQAPHAYAAFFGKTYILPNYRQGDYVSQKWEQWIAFDRVCTFAAGAAPVKDETWMCCLCSTVAALNYNRPTLFLERELGEALMRTDILEHLQTGDIKWRWPAFRVYLPKGLVTIDREGETERRWAVYFDVADVSEESGYSCPRLVAREIDAFAANNITQLEGVNLGLLTSRKFVHKEHAMIVSTALNKSDNPGIVQTVYAQTKPWGLITVTDYKNVGDDLRGGYQQDEADRRLLRKLEHLTLNVLLFLSSTPEDYEPEHILRTASVNPGKPSGELVKAHFVGDLYARAHLVGEVVKSKPVQHTGRHVAAHWVSGHWKRVVYGAGGSLRRLQWIQPYQTTDDERRHNDQPNERHRGRHP